MRGTRHANVGITLDTYSHVAPHMQEAAAERIDVGLRRALEVDDPADLLNVAKPAS